MKRKLAAMFLLLSVLVQVSGCGTDEFKTGKTMTTPVKFYYCSTNAFDADYYENDNGSLDWEYRDIGDRWPSAAEMIAMILDGPASDDLYSPFPRDTSLKSVQLQNGALTIEFHGGLSSLSGVEMTMAAACLVHTMRQYPGVETVEIKTETSVMSSLVNVPLNISDFVMQDDFVIGEGVMIRLYFPQEGECFLQGENRIVHSENEDIQPEQIIMELLTGSANRLSMPAVPDGTKLLSISVADSVCTLDLSSEFQINAPESALEARQQLLSIVNSLTEENGIKYIQLLCEGKRIGSFGPLELPIYLTRDETAIEARDPVSFDAATLYIPVGSNGLLAPVPVNVRKSAGKTLEQAVLERLISFEDQNGYTNVIPDDTVITEFSCTYRLCTISLSNSFLKCDTSSYSAQAAVRSIVSTLCSLETVDRVQIRIEDGEMKHVDLSQIHTVQSDWLLP